MKKVFFDNITFFYKDIFNISKFKNNILKECHDIRKNEVPFDSYRMFLKKNQDNNFLINYKPKSYLDVVAKHCIGKCIKIYKKKYKKINIEYWLNVVRAKKPTQNFNGITFHRHTDTCKHFLPTFTFIYYIQMPDNLQNDDGFLFFEGENKKIYHYLPKENDLIIMPACTPHVPSPAYKSTKDRIVLACNIGFETTKKIHI